MTKMNCFKSHFILVLQIVNNPFDISFNNFFVDHFISKYGLYLTRYVPNNVCIIQAMAKLQFTVKTYRTIKIF